MNWKKEIRRFLQVNRRFFQDKSFQQSVCRDVLILRLSSDYLHLVGLSVLLSSHYFCVIESSCPDTQMGFCMETSGMTQGGQCETTSGSEMVADTLTQSDDELEADSMDVEKDSEV